MLQHLILGSVIAVAISGICNDKRTDCANWARDGECSGDNAVRCLSLLLPRAGRERILRSSTLTADASAFAEVHGGNLPALVWHLHALVQ